MTLHIYLDPELTQAISEGGGSRPDADDYDGTSGESKDRQLFIANEWGALSAPLDASQTLLHLAEARFQDGEIIVIGSEQMQIVSGGGTTTLNVQRGACDTVRAVHVSGAALFSGNDYSGLTLAPIDSAGSDESGWYRLALTQAGLDGAAAGAPLLLGDKTHAQTLSFWRRCTVPAGTNVQNKTDLKLRLSGTQHPIS